MHFEFEILEMAKMPYGVVVVIWSLTNQMFLWVTLRIFAQRSQLSIESRIYLAFLNALMKPYS